MTWHYWQQWHNPWYPGPHPLATFLYPLHSPDHEWGEAATLNYSVPSESTQQLKIQTNGNIVPLFYFLHIYIKEGYSRLIHSRCCFSQTMKSSSEVFASVEFQYSVSAESLSKWALFSDSPRLLCGGRVPDPPPLPVICPGVTNAGDTRDIGHPGHSYSRTSTCWSSSEPNGFSKIISITASAQSIIQSVFIFPPILHSPHRHYISAPPPLHLVTISRDGGEMRGVVTGHPLLSRH